MAARRTPESLAGQVAVVTGGGGGIGTAVALELARQGATVVAADPGVGVHGEPEGAPVAAATAARITAAGGTARSSTVSVTDGAALDALFEEVQRDFGSLDIVVNAAGILGRRSIAEAGQDDWSAVAGVHFDGYRNVLAAALPRMEAAGYGRIVGFTSGVGLARTSAGGPAYGSAKRAVAALTWQLGPFLPPGVAANALSPIAATRMVRDALGALSAGHRQGPPGLDLSSMPQPEDMAPAAAYLSSAQFGWGGQVVFSAGSELSLIGPPRLLEGIRADGPGHFGAALATVVPEVLGPAAAGQATTGGSNPRFGDVFGLPAPAPPDSGAGPGRRCLVVADDEAAGAQVAAAAAAWGFATAGIGAWRPFEPQAGVLPATFEGVARLLRRAEAVLGPIDALIAAPGYRRAAAPPAADWRGVLAEHAGTTAQLLGHAAWQRAAADLAARQGRALRVVHLAAAQTTGERSAAQAVAQLARSANDTPGSASAEAYAISAEDPGTSGDGPLAALAARLIAADDARVLAGAELFVRSGWIGLRSHPGPVATLSFGGPALPGWAGDGLREAMGGSVAGGYPAAVRLGG